MKNISAILLPLCLLLSAGCSEESPSTYGSEAGAYFYRGTDFYSPSEYLSQHDSINHTFIDVAIDLDRYELPVWVKVMGGVSSSPRRVKFVQTNTGGKDAAIAGVHYVAFDAPEAADKMVVKAGASQARIPVILLRDASIETGRYRLEFEIAPCDDFPLTLDDKKTFVVTTTGQYEKPKRWDSYWSHAFGAWGPVKMWFIVHVVGFNNIGDETLYAPLFNSLQKRANEKLKEYNAGKPESEHLRENDEAKTKVVFPG